MVNTPNESPGLPGVCGVYLFGGIWALFTGPAAAVQPTTKG